PNAIYYKTEMVYNEREEEITNIIYVGRLTKNKKPLFLVKAFSDIYKDLDKNTKLIIIGDGEEKKDVLDFVNNNKLQDRVLVLGHISDYDLLKEYYNTALLSVSPGYLGLSVTQSFGFGVPMLISKDEKHSPEVEAVRINHNAKYFKTDDLNALGNSIVEMFLNKKFWIQQRRHINEACLTHYSIETMADPFIKLVE
ncbi:MAG: glycosyltransferase, partial [Flavobacteriaceae bacterium]|nr:glycosyltransferase [Flavobacteriaceae bacterium]